MNKGRWVLGGLLGIVFLCALFPVEEHIRGRMSLTSWTKEKARKGEELDVRRLEPPRLKLEENAALEVIPLAKQLAEEAPRSPQSMPKLMEYRGNNNVVAVLKINTWESPKPDGGKEVVTNNWNDLARELKGKNLLLDQLIRASKKPRYFSGVVYTNGFSDLTVPGLAQFRTTFLWLASRELDQLKAGRPDEAFETLKAMNRLIVSQNDERLLISQLVRNAMAQIVLQCTWQALQVKPWNDGQLALLQQQWEQNHFTDDTIRALEVERAMNMNEHQILISSRKRVDEMIEGQGKLEDLLGADHPIDPKAWWFKHLYVPFWMFAWAEQDARHGFDSWDATIDGARIARKEGWAHWERGLVSKQLFILGGDDENLNVYDRLRYLLSGRSNFSKVASVKKASEADGSKEMMRTALALERFSMRHGAYPAELSALVPEFLDAIPRDPMSGGALQYRLNADGSFLLYSVGEDGRDDGGAAEPRDSETTKRMIWNGRDAVWPVASERD